MTVRVRGKEELHGKALVRLETETAGSVTKTEFVAAEERALFCYRRVSPDGKAITFDPPLLLVPANLAVGAKWEVTEPAATGGARQEFNVAADEDVTVPAGKFHAFRIRLEQPWPVSVETDRWYVPEIGFVKEITATRGPTGRLLSRTTTLLTKFVSPPLPPAQDSPAKAPQPAPPDKPIAFIDSSMRTPKIDLELAKEGDGAALTEFRSDVPNIFIRWRAENLPVNGTIRVAWIAEDVGDVAPANFIVDENEAPVTEPNFSARFTLSRPKDGWAAGKYRVEVYLNDELLQTVRAQISD